MAEFLVTKRSEEGYEDMDTCLSEKDVRYVSKLINNDLNYRQRRAATREYPGSDAMAISKARALLRKLRALLE